MTNCESHQTQLDIHFLILNWINIWHGNHYTFKGGILYNFPVYNEESSLERSIENLKVSINEVDYILSNIDYFEDEYYDFSSIKDMIFYILDNKSLLHYISLVKDLLNSFQSLFQFKKISSNEEYNKKYKEFSCELIDIEQFFFTEIYEPSENIMKKRYLRYLHHY